MVAVDFRGDNQQELLTVGGSRGVVVFGIVDVPNRVWTDSEIDFGQSVGGALALAVGDLNGDGRPDVVTGTGSSSAGVVNTIAAPAGQSLVNTAPKSFPSIVGLFHLVTGDFDGDGHVDVLAAGGYGHAAVHAGDGTGALGAPQDVPLVGAGNPAYTTVADAAEADVDRNGTADAVVLDELHGTFEVLRNLVAPPPAPGAPGGGGAPAPAPVVPITPAAPKPAPVAPKPGPLTGLSGLVSSATADSSFILTLGKAANPPTRAVTLTLTVSGASASARKKAHRRRHSDGRDPGRQEPSAAGQAQRQGPRVAASPREGGGHGDLCRDRRQRHQAEPHAQGDSEAPSRSPLTVGRPEWTPTLRAAYISVAWPAAWRTWSTSGPRWRTTCARSACPMSRRCGIVGAQEAWLRMNAVGSQDCLCSLAGARGRGARCAVDAARRPATAMRWQAPLVRR